MDAVRLSKSQDLMVHHLRAPHGGSSCPRWCTRSPQCTPLPSCPCPSRASSSPGRAWACRSWAAAAACPSRAAGAGAGSPPAQSAGRPPARLAFPAASRLWCTTCPGHVHGRCSRTTLQTRMASSGQMSSWTPLAGPGASAQCASQPPRMPWRPWRRSAARRSGAGLSLCASTASPRPVPRCCWQPAASQGCAPALYGHPFPQSGCSPWPVHGQLGTSCRLEASSLSTVRARKGWG